MALEPMRIGEGQLEARGDGDLDIGQCRPRRPAQREARDEVEVARAHCHLVQHPPVECINCVRVVGALSTYGGRDED